MVKISIELYLWKCVFFNFITIAIIGLRSRQKNIRFGIYRLYRLRVWTPGHLIAAGLWSGSQLQPTNDLPPALFSLHLSLQRCRGFCAQVKC